MKNKTLKQLLYSLLAALVVTCLIAGAGVLKSLDTRALDAWYQGPKALDGEIILIEIDDRAIDELGPYNTWGRDVMAKALEKLAVDSDARPAAVAIDALYVGETEKENDDRLAAAAKELGCVITATHANIGTKAVMDDDGNLKYDYNAVFDYEEPFDALKEASTQGHINAMYDTDGILRHALLYVEPEGGKIYSMAFEAARAYAKANGMTIEEPPTDAEGHYYVSFSALPGGFDDGYSIVDLINGDISPDEFEGKIVYIGPYTIGLQDAYFTPVDHAKQMYGVEYQANVTQAILDGAYKTEVKNTPQAIALFIICFIAFFLFQKVKMKVSTAITVGIIGAYIGASFVFYNKKINGVGHVLHPLWIPVGVLVLYIVSIVINYVRSVIEKRRVTKTFERYVAPEIVTEILKEGIENLSLGGKTCDIAVLFVDVRGFTTMSERLTPEKVVFILNKYLTMASDCVERNKGTLDKFVGDAMMAFWGAPLAQEDAVYNAVKTAKEIVEGAARVSDELKAEIGEELRVGVGVNFGPAVVGNMGAEKHMDYTAIGDTVNTAARLEANAPGGKVYISRAVADELGDRITYTSLGATIKLKGKAEGFEVLDLHEVK
ncbi:MAG: CHASE2 domain-containing protein [Lachnospiraceae bacterium]|jgi:adenylate cyclase|nr:CHASE2 domain-containing protein [Lachnospiraceae bacterium]